MSGERLTDYEKREIESYPEVWYLGLDAKKIEGEEGGQLNAGYDDENGSYNKVRIPSITLRVYSVVVTISRIRKS